MQRAKRDGFKNVNKQNQIILCTQDPQVTSYTYHSSHLCLLFFVVVVVVSRPHPHTQMIMYYPHILKSFVRRYTLEQAFRMATVYLPFGYPLQSGSTYDVLTYQGSMVRLYTVPIDPRTNTQMFERRLLGDTSKVRSMLGAFGKAACKTVFGSKWSTNVYQLLRSDEGVCWSDAEIAWNGFTLSNQEAWRIVAPYQATYNDPGKAFYMYARCVAQLLETYSGLLWGAQIWGEGDSAAALAWWNLTLSQAVQKGKYNQADVVLVYSGSWTTGTGGADWSGDIKQTAVNGAACAFYYYGTSLTVGYREDWNMGIVNLNFDGSFHSTIDQYGASAAYQQSVTISPMVKGLHYLQLIKASGSYINVDFVTGN